MYIQISPHKALYKVGNKLRPAQDTMSWHEKSRYMGRQDRRTQARKGPRHGLVKARTKLHWPTRWAGPTTVCIKLLIKFSYHLISTVNDI